MNATDGKLINDFGQILRLYIDIILIWYQIQFIKIKTKQIMTSHQS